MEGQDSFSIEQLTARLNTSFISSTCKICKGLACRGNFCNSPFKSGSKIKKTIAFKKPKVIFLL